MPWIAKNQQGTNATAFGFLSINPKAADAVRNLGRSVTFGSSALTRVEEEAIAVAVSVANRCRY